MFSLGQRPRNWNQSVNKALKARFNAWLSVNPVFGAGSFGVVNPGAVPGPQCEQVPLAP
jgi:hypothetical protein